MTFGELKTAVDALGGQITDLSEAFPDISSDGNAGFCSIVTRAMEEINLLRPRVSETVIHCQAPRTMYAMRDPIRANGFEISLSGGMTYTFEVKGVGKYFVDGVETAIRSPYSFTRIADFVGNAKRITFSSDYTLTIRNIAVYSEAITEKVEDIPAYGARAEYAVEEADFVALSDSSISIDDLNAYDVKIRDSRIVSVPWDTFADIEVSYKRKIAKVTIDTNDHDELDLDDDLARQLLPTLVASYAFFDSSDAFATMFRTIYEKDRAFMMTQLRSANNTLRYETNNW
jgi:hypothetical protein